MECQWSCKPHPLPREEGSGHAVTTELSPGMQLSNVVVR